MDSQSWNICLFYKSIMFDRINICLFYESIAFERINICLFCKSITFERIDICLFCKSLMFDRTRPASHLSRFAPQTVPTSTLTTSILDFEFLGREGCKKRKCAVWQNFTEALQTCIVDLWNLKLCWMSIFSRTKSFTPDWCVAPPS